MRGSITKITFERGLDFVVKEDGTEGTGDHTLLAGDTLFPIDVVDTILHHNGSRWTVLHAFSNLALSANNRHAYDRVRVDHHDPNRTLFGVVYTKAMNGADQFTDLTTGTSFRYHGQFPRHLFLRNKLNFNDQIPAGGRQAKL